MRTLCKAALWIASLIFWGKPGVAFAQAQQPPSAQPPSQTLLPPSLKAHAEAIYPPDALRDRLEGTVGLELTIDEAGRVTDARVTSPAGHGFDEAALAAAREFVFTPATEAGAPTRAIVQFAYEFHLPARPPAPAPVPSPSATPAPDASAPAVAKPLPGEVTQAGQSTLVLAQKPFGEPTELEHLAASDSSTSQSELQLRPHLRAEGCLDAVPGLFTVQHCGGGKAQQYFLRGFDLDHGTDIAFFTDGVPVNAVSHAHGQGFSDLHFLIPETIEAVDSTKGPYSARVGDFATSGSVTFHMADHLEQSVAKVEVGQYGHERAVVVESPDLGENWRMAIGAEAFRENGPFIHPEDYDRLNGYFKVTRVLDLDSEVSMTLQAYSGTWNASGALPARAVCGEADGTPTPAAYAGSHCISRWDSLDPTQGGGTQRAMATADYKRRFANDWDLDAAVYVLRESFQLFPNDGIAASFQPDGIQYGSQIEQDDTRTMSGTNVRLTKQADVDGLPFVTTIGLQLRNDAIESQLHRTQGRVRLDGVSPDIPGPIYDGNINETELGIYGEEEVRLARWFRFAAGARFDDIGVAVNNESETAMDKVSGVRSQAQVSPKASVIVSPASALDLYANYGRGFHSNDARTILEGSSTTLIATATGYEVGTTVRPVKGLLLSAVAFLLDLTSELTIDGDTASTSPSGPTRRYGTELGARYHFLDNVYADASFTAAHSRYTDAADVAAGTVYLPNAPVRTFSGGGGFRAPVGHGFTILSSLHVRSMSDRQALQTFNTLIETGYTVFDGQAGLRWRNVEVVADLLNIGNLEYREGQFAVASRLPGEGPNPPQGISFTPGTPRTLLVHAALYW
jgi:TonB family protein